MKTIRHLWREQRFVFIAFLVASTLALGFAARGISRAIYWANPAHHQQMPEAWMTPGYIARSWHVKLEDIDAALGISNGPELVGNRRPTLEAIATALGQPVAALIDRLATALPEIPTDQRAP